MEYNGKFRLYESPLGMSENFDEVVPDVVSLSPNLGGLVKPWGIIHDTVFDSVKLVPYKEPTDVSVFLDSLHP